MLCDETCDAFSPYFFPSFLPPRFPLFTAKVSLRSFEGGGVGEGRNFTLERNGDGVETFFHFLIQEEEACSMRGGHVF